MLVKRNNVNIKAASQKEIESSRPQNRSSVPVAKNIVVYGFLVLLGDTGGCKITMIHIPNEMMPILSLFRTYDTLNIDIFIRLEVYGTVFPTRELSLFETASDGGRFMVP